VGSEKKIFNYKLGALPALTVLLQIVWMKYTGMDEATLKI